MSIRAFRTIRQLGLALTMLFCATAEWQLHGADDPPLPAGLGAPSDQPPLPDGLAGGDTATSSSTNAPSETGTPEESPPTLPAGLAGGDPSTTGSAEPEPHGMRLPEGVHGFFDTRIGFRTGTDHYQDDTALGEARFQVGLDRRRPGIGFKTVVDLLYDPVADSRAVDLQRGDGWIDVRQANVFFTPLPSMDLKVGRQILTWGTGDLLFINDNFPKDWKSFFLGRDVDYLKAPSDAVKASLFTTFFSLDIVYTPQFDPDRFITGERLSFFNPALGRLSGEDAVIDPVIPDDPFTDDEWAVRLYRNIKGYELALYGYDGFWKSPAGQTADGRPGFPALRVYGGSVRGVAAEGIANLEVGYLDSRSDPDGTNPRIQNSEWRLLAGYERDLQAIASDLTVGIQYYVEHMQDFDAYRSTLPEGALPRDEDRHLVTLRVTKLLLQQTLEMSLFAYYSASDRDGYARPRITYKATDQWMIEAGANLLHGTDTHTFFGQFEDNSNVYLASRYSF